MSKDRVSAPAQDPPISHAPVEFGRVYIGWAWVREYLLVQSLKAKIRKCGLHWALVAAEFWYTSSQPPAIRRARSQFLRSTLKKEGGQRIHLSECIAGEPLNLQPRPSSTMNGYPNYGYYGQPMYPQQHQMHPSQMHMQQGPPGYPPFYPPHPSQQVPPAPIPVPYDPEAYANISAPANTKKKSRRSSAPTGNGSAPQPLKSALKKTAAAMAATPMVHSMEFPPANPGYNEYAITRQRTNSIGHLNGGESRRRVNSNPYSNHHGGIDPPFQPSMFFHSTTIIEPVNDNYSFQVHLFFSFVGSNEIKLENVTEFAMKELREKIWPLWPDGVESQPTSSSECSVKFRNQPWDMSGPNYLT